MHLPHVLRDDGLDENDRDILADMGHLRLPSIVDHDPDEDAASEPS